MNKNLPVDNITNKIDVSLTNSGQVVLGNEKTIIDKKKISEVIINFLEKNNFDNFEEDFIQIIKSDRIFNFFSYIELYEAQKYLYTNKFIPFLYFRYKFKSAGQQKKVWKAPPYLLIEPVSSCNFRCPMCFQIDKSFTRKPYMGLIKWDLFKKVVDEADKIGVGAITMASRGEPTLHPELGKMLKYISKKKNILQIKINTNASKFTQKLCDEIFEANITTVVISGDHYEKEKYEILRKNSKFEEIVKNVKMLFETRKKFPNCNTEIRISGIDLEKNLDKERFKEFWKEFADNVTVGKAIERWDTYKNQKDEIKSACNFLWDRMYVWFDGKTNPCDADYKSYLSYGDVSKNSILEVWNSKKIKDLREKHLNKSRQEIVPCDRCGIDFN
tara:strand:+ start:3178 stop:4338 length:1161 start_codon:yes stop_codon:yes gene_type:complete